MQLSRFLFFPLLALSLSACVLDKSSSKDEDVVLDDKTSIQPIKELEKDDKTLATVSEYVPQDGDQSVDLVSMGIYENNNLIAKDIYYSITNFSHVTELPNQFGYQHTEVGPYLRAEGSSEYEDSSVKMSSVVYATLTPPYELLISHDVNDQRYSTIEFNQQTKTSSHEADDGFMTQGETLTYTGQKQLFDEFTGNQVGVESSITKVTALDLETINIYSGTYTAAKASYQTEVTSNIYNNLSDSWTQKLQGYIWFDINTGTQLKTSATGTFIRDDFPSRVLTTIYISEFYFSDGFPAATVTAASSTQTSDKPLKALSLQEAVENTGILNKKISDKMLSIPSPIKISL